MNHNVYPIGGQGYITSLISSTVATFGTIVANSSVISATSATDVIVLNTGHAISITANNITKSISIGVDESQITSFVKTTGGHITGDISMSSSSR